MPTYGLLSNVRNLEYDCDYWAKIRVLYNGAKSLRDALSRPSQLRDELFPKHLGEEDWVYEERCRRACYLPHMTQLIDYVLSVLFSDPLTMTAGGDGEDEKPGSTDDFYADFFRNTARPGARAVTMNELLRTLAQDALLYRRAWVLVDFPRAPLDKETGERVRPANRREEEALKLDRAYCLRLDPDCVLDWENDEDDGELAWVMVHNVSRARATVEASRDKVVETFTVWDREGWVRYSWEYDEKKQGKPKDTAEPDLTERGAHTFGRVPVLPVEVPDGLWAGGKLENIAVELFNKISAISWGQYRSLFQILVAKLSNPDPTNPITEDPDRALTQPIGPGRIVQLAEKDGFGFVGPDAAPFKEAREYARELREEMHRVLHQMAQATSNSGAALGRSAESKSIDQSAGAVVSRELGRIFRDAAVLIYETVSTGRKDGDKEWSPRGMDQFDDVSLADMVAEAVALETVPIPSPTFQTNYKYDLAIRVLPGLTEDLKDKIFEELQQNLSSEALAEQAGLEAAIAGLDPNAPTEPEADGTEKPKEKLPPPKLPKGKKGAAPKKTPRKRDVR